MASPNQETTEEINTMMTTYDVRKMYNDIVLDAHKKFDINLHSRGWTLEFNKRKQALGICDYGNKRVEMSTHYLKINSREQTFNVLSHEVAHAIAGYLGDHGHGKVWKATHKSLGGDGNRLAMDTNSLTPKYVLINMADPKKPVLRGFHRKPSKDYSICYIEGVKSDLKVMSYTEYKTMI